MIDFAGMTEPYPLDGVKPIIVGEQNPYGGDPYYALYPSPEGCSGHRLCCLVLGMSRKAYLDAFVRVNLCPGPWKHHEAVEQADVLQEVPQGKFILCGAKVSMAFGLSFAPFSLTSVKGGGNALILPHPSGLSRGWNEPGAFKRARRMVASFLPEVAPLLGE